MNFLQQTLAPYAQEAREWATAVRGDGAAYIERVIAAIDRVTAAVLDEEWAEGRVMVHTQLVDLAQVWDLDTDGLTVPQGTYWYLEVFSGMSSAGSGNAILRANGKFRGAMSMGTSGPGSAGVAMFRGVRFNPGDLIQVETTNMAVGRTLDVYLQFRTKAIKPRPTHSPSIGRPEAGADRPNDNGDDLARHSTPGVFQGANVRGDTTARDPHMPPALPFIGVS